MDLSETKERIRRIMKREDITIEAAAEAAGVSQSTVRRWSNPSDDTDIGLHAFSKFALAFDISMDALMFPTPRTDDPAERDIDREWRAQMDWWNVHFTPKQKLAVMECIKAIWQVSSQISTGQLWITDPEKVGNGR